MGFPDGLAGKESTCNAGDTGDQGSIHGSKRSPWRRKWQPTSLFLPEKKSMNRGSWKAAVQRVAKNWT